MFGDSVDKMQETHNTNSPKINIFPFYLFYLYLITALKTQRLKPDWPLGQKPYDPLVQELVINEIIYHIKSII